MPPKSPRGQRRRSPRNKKQSEEEEISEPEENVETQFDTTLEVDVEGDRSPKAMNYMKQQRTPPEKERPKVTDDFHDGGRRASPGSGHRRTPSSGSVPERGSPEDQAGPSARCTGLTRRGIRGDGKPYPCDHLDRLAAKDKKKTPGIRKQKDVPCHDNTSIMDMFSFKHFCGICLLVVLVVIYVFFVSPALKMQQRIEEEPVDKESQVKKFVSEVKGLENQFVRQEKRLWSTIRAPVKRILIDDFPTQPAVILLVSEPDASATMACLTLKLAESIRQATGKNTFNLPLSHLNQLGADDAKFVLDDKLRKSLGDGSFLVTVSHVELLQGNTAMLLHAYCDNDNAPFKNATILFTLDINHTKLRSRTPTDWDDVVEEYLTQLWEPVLGIDNVHAILSRIANNVAVVRTEQQRMLSTVCG